MSSDNENNAYAKSTFPPDVASILALPTSGMRFPSKREVAEYIAVVDAVRGKDNKLSRKETLYDTAAYPNGYQKILCTKCKGRFTIHFTSAAKDKKVKTETISKIPTGIENFSILALRWHYVCPLFFQGFVNRVLWNASPPSPPPPSSRRL